MRQRLYLNDNEIGKSVLPLWMLMEQKPWGKQYTTSLGLCHGRATLTFRLQLFAFPDNSSPPLSTPLHALEKLEKRFGKEITLLDNIQPPANVLGFLQVNNPPRELILSSHSLDICLAATHIPPPPVHFHPLRIQSALPIVPVILLRNISYMSSIQDAWF
jgi:hypothetical protein